MNILIVPTWYQNEKNSVLGSFFREQALALSKCGHNVFLADATFQSLNNLKSDRLFKLCKYNDEGIQTYSFVVPSFGLMRTPSGGLNLFYSNLLRIYNALCSDGIKIDVIHAHVSFLAGVAATRLGKKFNIPVVITEHSSLVLTGKLTNKRVDFLSEALENSDKFICVSSSLKEAVKRLTKTDKPIEIIPNLVNPIFNFEQNDNNEQFSFISIGNLIKSKRFDLTLRAFAKIYNQNNEVKLVIIGDGILKKDLEQLAFNLGVSEAVCFKGRLSREDVSQELKKSNVFILPSDFETFGVVYIEALACGCPIIATKNGGANYIVQESNGLLIDVNNEQQLFEAMIRMFNDYDKYNRSSISADCHATYGEKSFVTRILQIYNSIL